MIQVAQIVDVLEQLLVDVVQEVFAVVQCHFQLACRSVIVEDFGILALEVRKCGLWPYPHDRCQGLLDLLTFELSSSIVGPLVWIVL